MNWTWKRTGNQGFVELAALKEKGDWGTALEAAAEEALIGRELRVERGDLAIRLPRGATRTDSAGAGPKPAPLGPSVNDSCRYYEKTFFSV
jgi:hypothetical protein